MAMFNLSDNREKEREGEGVLVVYSGRCQFMERCVSHHGCKGR